MYIYIYICLCIQIYARARAGEGGETREEGRVEVVWDADRFQRTQPRLHPRDRVVIQRVTSHRELEVSREG